MSEMNTVLDGTNSSLDTVEVKISKHNIAIKTIKMKQKNT